MLREFVIGLLVICVLLITKASAQSCPAIPNVAQACVSASYTAPRVLVDMSTFKDDVNNNCTCSFSTNSKVLKIVTYNAPNYQACNSAIRLSSTSGNSVRFQCLMSGTYLDTSIHNTGEINFETYEQAYDTNYCLVMEQTGATEATVTITCNGPEENITQSENSTDVLINDGPAENITKTHNLTDVPIKNRPAENTTQIENSTDLPINVDITTSGTGELTTQNAQSTSLPPLVQTTETVNTSSNASLISNNTVSENEHSVTSTSASSTPIGDSTDSTSTLSKAKDMSINFVTEATKVQASIQSSTFASSAATESANSPGSYQSTAHILDSTNMQHNENITIPIVDKAEEMSPIVSTSTVETNVHNNPLNQGYSTPQVPLPQYVGNTTNEINTINDNTLNDSSSFVGEDTHSNSSFVSSTTDPIATVTDIITGTVLLHGGDTSEKRFQIIDPVNTDAQGVTAKLIATPVDVPVIAETINKTENATYYEAGTDMTSSNMTNGNDSMLELITDNTININDTIDKDNSTVNYGLYFGASINDNIINSNTMGDSLKTDVTTSLYGTSIDSVKQDSTMNSSEYFIGNSSNDNSNVSSSDFEASSSTTLNTHMYDIATDASGNTTDNYWNDATTSNNFTAGIDSNTNAELSGYGYHNNTSNITDEVVTNTNYVQSSHWGYDVNTTYGAVADRTSTYDGKLDINTTESLVVGNQTSDGILSLSNSTSTMNNYGDYNNYMGVTDTYYRTETPTSTYNPTKDNVQPDLTNQFDYTGVHTALDATTPDYLKEGTPYFAPTTYNSDITGRQSSPKTEVYPSITEGTETAHGDSTSYAFYEQTGSQNMTATIDAETRNNFTNTLEIGNQTDGVNSMTDSLTTMNNYGDYNNNMGVTDTYYRTDKPTSTYNPTKDYAQPDLTNQLDYTGGKTNMNVTTGDYSPGTGYIDTAGHQRDSVTVSNPSTIGTTEMGYTRTEGSQGIGSDRYAPVTTIQPDYHGANLNLGMSADNYDTTDSSQDLHTTTMPYGYWQNNPDSAMTSGYDAGYQGAETTTSLNTTELGYIRDSVGEQANSTLNETQGAMYDSRTINASSGAYNDLINIDAIGANASYISDYTPETNYTSDWNHTMSSENSGSLKENVTGHSGADTWGTSESFVTGMEPKTESSVGYQADPNYGFWNTGNNETDAVVQSSTTMSTGNNYTGPVVNQTEMPSEILTDTGSIWSSSNSTTAENSPMNNSSNTNYLANNYMNEDPSFSNNTFMETAYFGDTEPTRANLSTVRTNDPYGYDITTPHSLGTYNTASGDSLSNNSVYMESTFSNDLNNGTSNIFGSDSNYTADISNSTNESYHNMNDSSFKNYDGVTVQMETGLQGDNSSNINYSANNYTNEDTQISNNTAYFGETEPTSPSTMETNDPYGYDTTTPHTWSTSDTAPGDSINNNSVYMESTYSNDINNGTFNIYGRDSNYTGDISNSTNESYHNMNDSSFKNYDGVTVQMETGLQGDNSSNINYSANNYTNEDTQISNNTAYFGETEPTSPSTMETNDPYGYDTTTPHTWSTSDTAPGDSINNNSVYMESTYSNDINNGTFNIYGSDSNYTGDISSSMNESNHNVNVSSFNSYDATTVQTETAYKGDNSSNINYSANNYTNEDTLISNNTAYFGETEPTSPSTVETKDPYGYDTTTPYTWNTFDTASADSLNNNSIYMDSTYSNATNNGTFNLYGSDSNYTDDISSSTNDSYHNMNVSSFNNYDGTTVHLETGLQGDHTANTTTTQTDTAYTGDYTDTTASSNEYNSTSVSSNTVQVQMTTETNRESTPLASNNKTDVDNLLSSNRDLIIDQYNSTVYNGLSATDTNDNQTDILPYGDNSQLNTTADSLVNTDTHPWDVRLGNHSVRTDDTLSSGNLELNTVTTDITNINITDSGLQTTGAQQTSKTVVKLESTIDHTLSPIDVLPTTVSLFDTDSVRNETITPTAVPSAPEVPFNGHMETYVNETMTVNGTDTDMHAFSNTTDINATVHVTVSSTDAMVPTQTNSSVFEKTNSSLDTFEATRDTSLQIEITTASVDTLAPSTETLGPTHGNTLSIETTNTQVDILEPETYTFVPTQDKHASFETPVPSTNTVEASHSQIFFLDTTNTPPVQNTETLEPTKGESLTLETMIATTDLPVPSTETLAQPQGDTFILGTSNQLGDSLAPSTETVKSPILETTYASVDSIAQATYVFEPTQDNSLILETTDSIAKTSATSTATVQSTEGMSHSLETTHMSADPIPRATDMFEPIQNKSLNLETMDLFTESTAPSTKPVESTEGNSLTLETTNTAVHSIAQATDMFEPPQDNSLTLDTTDSNAESTVPTINSLETMTHGKTSISTTTNALTDSTVSNTKSVEPEATLIFTTTDTSKDSIVSSSETSKTAQTTNVISTTTITSTSKMPIVRHSEIQTIHSISSETIPSLVIKNNVDDTTSKASVPKTTIHPKLENAPTKISTTERESTTRETKTKSTPLTEDTTKPIRFLPEIIPNDVIEKKESSVLDIRPPPIDVKPTTHKSSETTTTKELLSTRIILPDIIANDAVKTGETIVKDVRPPPIEIKPTTKRTFALIPESTDSGMTESGTTTGDMNVSFGDTLNAGLFEMDNKTYIIVVAAIAGLVVLAAVLGIVIHHSRRNRSDKVDISAGVPEAISHRNMAFENGDPEKGNGVVPNEMNGNGHSQETSGNGVNHPNGNHSSIEA